MALSGSPNALKAALAAGQRQIGFWSSVPSPLTVEIMADGGFHWLLLDTEHAPNDVPQVVALLQAAAAYPTEAVVRIPVANQVEIKRYLDGGARSLLIPFVQSAEEARAIVAATRYPPRGVRGVSVSHRGNRFGRVKGYLQAAEESLCLILQLETRQALAALEEIATLDGVDAVFIGPSDLAADFGQLGNAGHAEVQAGIKDAIDRCRAVNRPIGILAPVVEDARRYLDWGATLVAVGSDSGVLIRGMETLAQTFMPSQG